MSWDSFFTPSSDAPVELGTNLVSLVQTFTTDRKPSDVVTNLPDLNAMTLGFYPGELYVIAARPGQGKSSWALDIFLANVPVNMVYFLSLEMSKSTVLDRLLCNMANVSLHRTRAGMLTEAEINNLNAASNVLAQYHGMVDDSAALTLRTLRSKLTTAVGRGVRLAIIDYFQCMTEPSKASNTAGDAALLAYGIRAVAKDLGIPIILLSQLNRDIEKRGKPDDDWGKMSAPIPRLSDLYGGGLEQAADAIYFLYRANIESTQAKIVIAKNRNGPLGEVPCTWQPEFTSFRPLGDF